MFSTIILSSLFTLITTLWCCIRPDFPSPHDSKLRSLFTKLNIMFWVVICPELVFLWALRQWLEAGEVAKDIRGRGWTRRHGLFFLMGGFIFCNEDGQPTKTISFPHFTQLLEQKSIDCPPLTSFDIQERSNLHPLFVLLAFLQAIWFIAQCLSRFINAGSAKPDFLLLTQLEAIIATIVFANWCIFFFAWKKPLDPQCPILLKPITSPTRRSRHLLQVQRLEDEDTFFRKEENLCASQITERRFQFDWPRSTTRSFSKIFTGLNVTPQSLTSFILWPFRSICHDILNFLLANDLVESPEFPDGTLKIPLFYVRNTAFEPIFILSTAFLSTGISAISLTLALHSGSTLRLCSERAQLAWRIAAITSSALSSLTLGLIILINVVIVLSILLDSNHLFTKLMDGLLVLSLGLFFATIIVGFLPFFLARLVLIVVSIVCLNPTGQGSFVDQSWTDYIPHFSGF